MKERSYDRVDMSRLEHEPVPPGEEEQPREKKGGHRSHNHKREKKGKDKNRGRKYHKHHKRSRK